jgi:hypothetical protein
VSSPKQKHDLSEPAVVAKKTLAAPATATATKHKESSPLPPVVKKTLVPLSTPQGYDPDKQTLTVGRWQVSGVPFDPADDSPAIAQAHGEAAPGLMHKAHPLSNEGVVLGLAAYPNDILGKLERFVGTLRFTGYQGHIILGVHPNLSEREARYLQVGRRRRGGFTLALSLVGPFLLTLYLSPSLPPSLPFHFYLAAFQGHERDLLRF